MADMTRPHCSPLRRIARNLAAGPFAEPLMGLTIAMVGLAFMMPPQTFQIRTSFAVLSVVAREEVWGAVMIAMGVTQILAALLEHRFARLSSCMAGGAFWMFWTSATFYSASAGVLWAFGIAMIVGQGLAYLRAAVRIY